MVDLLNPLDEWDAYSSDAEEAKDKFVGGVVGDTASGVPTADTAQALANYRQALLNQLAALDDYVTEVSPSFSSVGGVPSPSSEYLTGLPQDDPRLGYLDPAPDGSIPEDDLRGRFTTYEEALRYIDGSSKRSIFRVYYDEDTDSWVVYIQYED